MHTPATGDFSHEPVMQAEILDVFAPIGDGVIVDATVGGGGHSHALLEAHEGIRVVGLDRDRAALGAAATRLARFEDRVTLRHAVFSQLRTVLAELDVESLTGFLFDLGVSSPQLDRPERGFSYRAAGPLDMRMDSTAALSAAAVVNSYDEARLADVIARYGDERHARRIARAIVAGRPYDSTDALRDTVVAAIPAAARRRGGHPAKRTFQALRIEVNGELEQLPGALDDAIDLLAPHGRGAVLSYHSGEDRIVKDRFANAVTGGCVCPPRLPCGCGAQAKVALLWRGSKQPSAAELDRNPRARSARLRGVERLGGAA